MRLDDNLRTLGVLTGGNFDDAATPRSNRVDRTLERRALVL